MWSSGRARPPPTTVGRTLLQYSVTPIIGTFSVEAKLSRSSKVGINEMMPSLRLSHTLTIKYVRPLLALFSYPGSPKMTRMGHYRYPLGTCDTRSQQAQLFKEHNRSASVYSGVVVY